MLGEVGIIIAEMVLGQEVFYDVGPFKIDEFGKADPLSHEFRQSCADARLNKKSG